MDPVAGAQANDAEAAPPERERLTRDISVSARPGAAVERPPPEGTKMEDRRVADRRRAAAGAPDPPPGPLAPFPSPPRLRGEPTHSWKAGGHQHQPWELDQPQEPESQSDGTEGVISWYH